MNAPTFVNTEIPRDRFGRPMVMPPGGGNRVPYRRTTTFVGCLDDTYGLMQWKTRQVALGMGQRKDLVLAAAAANPDDKKLLNEIADKATEHAQASAAATTGTALHALTERIDRGKPLGYVPAEYEADLAAYQQATEGIEWLGIETFRVHDDWKVAGTADRIGRTPTGCLRVYDIKTGSIDYPHKMAMQLAMYARMTPYDIPTDTRQTPEPGLDLNTGIIIHLPAGQGRCDLYEINIGQGWGACLLAKQVWSWRETRGLTHKIGEPRTNTWERANSDTPPPTWESLVAAAATLDDLRKVWAKAAEFGKLTTDFRALCTERSAQLAAATEK